MINAPHEDVRCVDWYWYCSGRRVRVSRAEQHRTPAQAGDQIRAGSPETTPEERLIIALTLTLTPIESPNTLPLLRDRFLTHPHQITGAGEYKVTMPHLGPILISYTPRMLRIDLVAANDQAAHARIAAIITEVQATIPGRDWTSHFTLTQKRNDIIPPALR